MLLRYIKSHQASQSLMYLFLREFQGRELNHKVLLFSDDIPERYFPFWASRMIDAKEDVVEDVDLAVLDKVIGDACIGLLKVIL